MAEDVPAIAGKRWYLVYSKPRQEELAKANLQRQGFVCYLPMARQPRRRMGKWQIEDNTLKYGCIRKDIRCKIISHNVNYEVSRPPPKWFFVICRKTLSYFEEKWRLNA